MDTLVVGPGLGREDDTKNIFMYFLENSLKIKSNN